MYIVVTPLRHGRGPKPTPPGEAVELDERQGDALVAIGALAHAPDDTVAPIVGIDVTGEPAAGQGEGVQLPGGTDGDGKPLAPIAKPLSAMKRAELVIEAARLDVTIAPGMTNKQVVAAIEAKQAGNA